MTSFDTNKQKTMASTGGLHLRVFEDIEAVSETWLALENNCIGTPYQSYAWCSTWLKRLSQTKNVTPCIVLAENEFGAVEFLLPLQLRKSKGFTYIEALTAPQAGYGFALFNRNFLETKAAHWFALHFENLTAILPAHDVFHLCDLPEKLLGYENPLLQSRHFLASNQSHIMDLESNYQAFYERQRSLVSRKSIRKRDAKLEAMEGLHFERCLHQADQFATLDVMFRQQEIRLGEAGVHNIFDRNERQFFLDLTDTETASGPLLQTYKLSLGKDVLAVILGAHQFGNFWALISSMTKGDIQKHSPGDYILRQVIKTLCEDGTRSLDFSSGDSPYKYHWSDRQVPLHFIIRANSLKGMPVALFLLLREKLKRIGKRTPVLNTLLFEARKLFKGQKF